jgi:hypothetical protein
MRSPLASASPARRVRTALSIVAVAFTAAGCAHYIGADPGEPCHVTPDLKTAEASALGACAHAVQGNADPRHGTGDEQRLAVIGAGGQLVYGPKATITPLRGYFGLSSVTAVTDKDLMHGLPLAVIAIDSAYPKLGLQAGKNILMVSIPEGEDVGTAVMVPLDGSPVTRLAVHATTHPDESDYPLATARWIWSDKDETIWVACGRRCCWVAPVAL